MSESEEAPQFHEHGEKAKARWGTFWWIFSVVVHVSAVAALIHFSPLREWFFKKGDIAATFDDLRGSRVHKIVDQMLRVNIKRLKEDIEQQKEIAGELEAILGRAYKRYAEEVEFLAANNRKVPPAEPLSKLGPAGPDINVGFERKGVLELYGLAQDVETTSFGLYRQMRAVELCRIQRIPMLEALGVTQMAPPKHPPIDQTRFITDIDNLTDGRMQALKEELNRVRAEVASMVQSGRRMLDMAKGLIGDDAGATFGMLGNMDGGVTAGGDDGLEKRLDDPFMGYSPPDPDAFAHDWGEGVGPIVHMNELFPQKTGADLGRKRPAPGTKLMSVTDASMQAEWMYIDTWYIIGPFPNPDRKNIDKKFPPESGMESGIDLDATYIGQKGNPVTWTYRKSIAPCVIPHKPRDWAIWYAYTEIYSHKDQDKWCIFGSDDYGKCWINGDPIYGSGKTPHPWIPDRAYKKVKFKKGFNAVLFKVKNAWGRTGFSMCIYMGEM